MADTAAPWASLLAWLAIGAASAAASLALLAGPGYRFAWWSLGPAMQAMFWSAIMAMGAVALCLIATVLAFRTKAQASLRRALLGLVIGLVVALPPLTLYLKAKSLPRIHDISTDTDHPPAFVAVLPLRPSASNSTEYTAENAAAQKTGYPDMTPKLLKNTPAEAFAKAEAAARRMDWEIVAVSPADYRIEATATSLLFGFKDDVVIRVTPHPEGSRIDVRSLSRVGISDLGVNARRIQEFMQRLEAK